MVPEPDPTAEHPVDPVVVEYHSQLVRALLSAAASVVLLTGAVLTGIWGYLFFPVVLVVLAVFAGVETTATLRRRRRRT